jgi:translation initiation factor RLI1
MVFLSVVDDDFCDEESCSEACENYCGDDCADDHLKMNPGGFVREYEELVRCEFSVFSVGGV